MTSRTYCTCGKIKSKYSTYCNSCHKKRMDAFHKEAIELVKTGKCPQCGSKLVRNSAIAGWWQCSCYGNWKEVFKENKDRPDCSFQCFTE